MVKRFTSSPHLIASEGIKTVTASELHTKVGTTINRVHFSQQPLIVTSRGEPFVLVVAVDAESAKEIRLHGLPPSLAPK